MKLPNPENLLNDITAQIKSRITQDSALVGIHSGGVWIMNHVLEALDKDTPYGTLDAALYRDDFAKRGLKATPQPANIPFDVNGKDIILIDDIFYTGRTTRAAMNELFDFGRPASISLAVLINRGGAQLPITPDIVGADIPLEASQALKLSKGENNQLQLALADNAGGGHV